MSIAIKVVWSVFWFVAGIAISGLAVELVRAMSGTSYYGYRPMPPGIFISAVVLAVLAWRKAPTPERLRAIVGQFAVALSRQARFGIALSVPWALAVLGLAFLSDAISAQDVSYWRSKDWLRFLGLAFGPPFLSVLTLYLWRWADAPTIASGKPPDVAVPEALVHDNNNSAGSSSGMPSSAGERGVSAADSSTTETDDDAIRPPSVRSARAKLAAILKQQDDTPVVVPEASETIASSNKFTRPRLSSWLRNGTLLLIAAIAAYSVLLLFASHQRQLASQQRQREECLEGGETALYACHLTIKNNPNDFRALAVRCAIFSSLRDIDSAIKDCISAMRGLELCGTISPNEPDCYAFRGLVLVALGDIHGGLLEYKEALARDYRFASAWIWLATAHKLLGQADEAIGAYRSALAVDPKNKNALDGLRKLGVRP